MKKFIGIIFTFLVISLYGLSISNKAVDDEKNLCLYVMSSNNKKICAWRKDVIENIAKYYKVIIISNGELDDKCDNADKIIVRPNEGYDFGAWKEYIVENYDYIKQFDNLLIANDSFYKVASMDEVIEKGLNSDFDLYGIKYRADRLFLESYFINIKKRVVNSECFINFWLSMPEIKSWGDACGYGEARFTEYFRSYGFSSQDFKNTDGNTNIYDCARWMTDEWDFPIVKRKSVK